MCETELCAAELSPDKTMPRQKCEDELFQSEVSWSRNIQTEICENKICKAHTYLAIYLKSLYSLKERKHFKVFEIAFFTILDVKDKFPYKYVTQKYFWH